MTDTPPPPFRTFRLTDGARTPTPRSALVERRHRDAFAPPDHRGIPGSAERHWEALVEAGLFGRSYRKAEEG